MALISRKVNQVKIMKQIRILALIMALILVTSFAIACSSNEKTDGTTSATTVKTTPKVTTDGSIEIPPEENITPETPVTDDAFTAWHEGFTVVPGLNPKCDLPTVWGDGTITNIFDGKDGYFNTTDAATKLGGGDASGLVTLTFEAPNSTLVAYSFILGNDSGDNTGRSPEAWCFYGCNVDPATAQDDDWKLIDEVQISGIVDKNAAPFGYTIDTDKQATYSYYKIEFYENLGGSAINVLQLNEMYLYAAKA